MRKPGRPTDSTKHSEKATKSLTLRLTPTAYKWVKEQPRGFIPDWIEEQAKEKPAG